MATKSAVIEDDLLPTPAEIEAARNSARAMKQIMDNLDKQGELTKFLHDYRRILENYSGSKTAKKK